MSLAARLISEAFNEADSKLFTTAKALAAKYGASSVVAKGDSVVVKFKDNDIYDPSDLNSLAAACKKLGLKVSVDFSSVIVTK